MPPAGSSFLAVLFVNDDMSVARVVASLPPSPSFPSIWRSRRGRRPAPPLPLSFFRRAAEGRTAQAFSQGASFPFSFFLRSPETAVSRFPDPRFSLPPLSCIRSEVK